MGPDGILSWARTAGAASGAVGPKGVPARLVEPDAGVADPELDVDLRRALPIVPLDLRSDQHGAPADGVRAGASQLSVADAGVDHHRSHHGLVDGHGHLAHSHLDPDVVGEALDVELTDSQDEITFDRVLAVGGDGEARFGTPTVEGAVVKASVLSNVRGPKIKVFKKKRRKGYKRLTGHRQDLQRIRIDEVSA